MTKSLYGKNYEFADSLHCDLLYSQMLNPYPKTNIREYLLELDLLVNPTEIMGGVSAVSQ